MANVSDVFLPLRQDEETFALQSELEAVEKQIQDLLERQTRLRELKTALETSRADARKSAVSFHRDCNTPSTSTPRVSLHRAQASRTRSAQMNFTPAPAHPWRKARARTGAMTQSPPPVFEIPKRNRFAALCETECNAVVIGDSIVQNVSAILKDDANVGAIVLHTGVNDVRMRQSEIVKRDFRSLIETVRNASPTARIIVSGPLPTYRRGNENDLGSSALTACTPAASERFFCLTTSQRRYAPFDYVSQRSAVRVQDSQA
ncbi:uncharacterized protein LOC130549523 [Triplophysa rosa]|uniref:uncharacterized protein LOC130549523 n=1 Tax=Triplophysa rosa TaxID=992332 RepID=UPI002545F59C|nr:uncharacterized protein LOC130549523 [Triplophysa rosa]